MTKPTRPDDATREAERKEASVPHDADRPPTDDEERDAPTEVAPTTREAFREMAERGAQAEGEGRIP